MKNTLLATVAAITLMAGNAEAAQIKKVEFTSQGERVIGNLYLPDDYKEGTKLPAVIVTGAWMTVKEQMPAIYAAQMADKGYAALTFDFRGWGESKHVNKAQNFIESPTEKTQDIVAAAEFLTTRDEVDSTQISGLGMCASAGYMAGAAVQSANIQSITLVAPWLHDREIVETVYGGVEGINKLLEASKSPQIVLAASETDKTAIMNFAGYYTDPKRGAIKEFDNKFNTASWPQWLGFDGIQYAAQLNKPVLLIHSEAAAIPQGAKEFTEKSGAHAKLVMLDNVTQFDFYDKPEIVAEASSRAISHFTQKQ
jgi:uncharacterized protein